MENKVTSIMILFLHARKRSSFMKSAINIKKWMYTSACIYTEQSLYTVAYYNTYLHAVESTIIWTEKYN
ncbi:hypothetical protein V1478_007901 [Vespula squamosa]|uniref:Uncharacterized protein n=1 Tax=Vespula squamosa TaxID=30214 RepID=A0ABD2AX97_VESSQ